MHHIQQRHELLMCEIADFVLVRKNKQVPQNFLLTKEAIRADSTNKVPEFN